MGARRGALARGRALARRASAPWREPDGGAATCLGDSAGRPFLLGAQAAVTAGLGCGVGALGRRPRGPGGSLRVVTCGAAREGSGCRQIPAAASPGGVHAPARPDCVRRRAREEALGVGGLADGRRAAISAAARAPWVVAREVGPCRVGAPLPSPTRPAPGLERSASV